MKTKLLAIFIITVIILTSISLVDDLRMFRIVSPSMEPAVPVGSLVIVSKTEPIEVGDVVAYELEVLGRKYTVVHRVVDVEDGVYMVKADVDASGLGERVEAGRIIGKAVLVIPYLGYLAGAFIAVPAIIILIPIIGKKGGLGFPAAAFISFLPSVLPLQGLASILGNIYFTTIMVGAVIVGRIIELKDEDMAEIIYTLAAGVSVVSINVLEVVRWFA
ncbi:MAG: signal peptidase I [Nitrososphaerota archaeon]